MGRRWMDTSLVDMKFMDDSFVDSPFVDKEIVGHEKHGRHVNQMLQERHRLRCAGHVCGEEPFYLLCVRAHSLAALIAMARASVDAIDPAPLLLSGDENEGSNSNGGGEQRRSSSVRRPWLREAARLLSRASSGGGRAMREPSMVVREAAAEQLEERESDWAYSKPIVVLDIMWNLAFVSVAGAILVMARNEHPIMPLRVWLLGYALQCVLHMVCVG
ncbi:hypothetical protein F2Q70_00032124 [Brassica cretica]|uniref:RING-type E3 ubiquitin transferase n=1 Tax=Brassica cretica TaxID=69181 RepID=A0A8S9FMF7_BRACR|nr:hypothetical protein F2Q70_00032124 [Brassica cretica]